MSAEERVELLEGQIETAPQETIIPAYQAPKECVFCTEKYDAYFCNIVRLFYQHKNNIEIPRQKYDSCIHHKDKWLKQSYRTAGFMQNAINKSDKDEFNLKEDRELIKRLLTEFYDTQIKYSSAMSLYVTDSKLPELKNRYKEGFTIEDDVDLQNKIIRNKIKTWYQYALEVME